ncbi:MAG: 16S rRNA (cytidine(1402)-2'-O)-methyltransferase [Acidobacteria bacterium]|nr:MAG: 16S rRNA (cytidine(1402)-2'-O)-methyltransferase [Acidobacteriota bacterium]PYR40920.1 MAG: 16S rRNA (cytidine(1402)-2'-O)-methyltransferase [Acidobacteriota bacterium]
MPGTLFVVATPIGNLEDITVRALRVLGEVAVIAAEDTRRTAHLLARHAIATPTTSLHEHNERSKSASLVTRLQRGDHVALVSDAGTPTISDPGGRLIREAISAGIRVEAIPGPSAVLTALAASGLPTDAFSFLGFPPTKSKDRKKWFLRAGQVAGTLVFFEAPHRIRATLKELYLIVGNCQITIGRELTKLHEELVRGQILDVLDGPLEERGEFTVVVFIGDITDNELPAAPSPSELVTEFCDMTVNREKTRRQAIGILARKHGFSPNAIYAVLEAAKKSGK